MGSPYPSRQLQQAVDHSYLSDRGPVEADQDGAIVHRLPWLPSTTAWRPSSPHTPPLGDPCRCVCLLQREPGRAPLLGTTESLVIEKTFKADVSHYVFFTYFYNRFIF